MCIYALVYSCASGNGGIRIAWAHYLGAMIFDAIAIAIASSFLWTYRMQARTGSGGRGNRSAVDVERVTTGGDSVGHSNNNKPFARFIRVYVYFEVSS